MQNLVAAKLDDVFIPEYIVYAQAWQVAIVSGADAISAGKKAGGAAFGKDPVNMGKGRVVKVTGYDTGHASLGGMTGDLPSLTGANDGRVAVFSQYAPYDV